MMKTLPLGKKLLTNQPYQQLLAKVRYLITDMKRYTDLYDKIVNIDNLYLADKKARKQKSNRPDIIKFDKNKDQLLLQLQQSLISGKYKTSEYHTFKIYEPKEREIFRLPYYPDRIVHHAIMNVMEPIWLSCFINNTYSCIKKRGIHKALKDVKAAMKDINGTQYCLKLDIRKFYPSINHDILKKLIRRKIKDARLLVLLDEIIDSANGVPIGNYLSQFFANFYLSYFDHWIKEELKVKYYFRYADDIVILHHDKQFLKQVLLQMQDYLQTNLKLQIKSNWQIFQTDSRGIDFVGYKIFHTHTLLRKSIKKSFCKKISRLNKDDDLESREYKQQICSYLGWLKYCNARNLLSKLTKYKELLNYITITSDKVT